MKKHIIIGTAGHIDHGKTTLIKALTGYDCDRWAQEKDRGITMDLGFTYFDLPSGNRAGIIDVPGHEKFVRNMVAGVVGMDMVLLVIAADEGIMPQTKEHMDILSLLGVENCIVVLTKCDMVDEDWLELVKEDLREGFKGTFLENAPMCQVSSVTREGFDELISLIDKNVNEIIRNKEEISTPRLPIDRAFNLTGLGTIVTGTLISGTIKTGDSLYLYPIGKPCRVRSIQVHSNTEDVAYAGQRVALNLTNVKKDEIYRGCVIAPEGSIENTRMINAKLELLKDCKWTLKNFTRLHFLSGTAEILCRCVLLDKDELTPGEEGLVQLRLEEETVVKKGDRYIVRFYSPVDTIGGGIVLEGNAMKNKRFDEETIKKLEARQKGSVKDILLIQIQDSNLPVLTRDDLARANALSLDEVNAALKELFDEKEIISYDSGNVSYLWDTQSRNRFMDDIKDKLEAYYAKNPYRIGFKKAEFVSQNLKKVKPYVIESIMSELEESNIITRNDEFIIAKDHEILKDEKYERISGKILSELKNAGYNFVWFKDIEIKGVKPFEIEDITNYLSYSGDIVKIADNMFTLREYADEAVRKIKEVLNEKGIITISEVRDMFDTSRKSAKPILEYLDKLKITRKEGAESERTPY